MLLVQSEFDNHAEDVLCDISAARIVDQLLVTQCGISEVRSCWCDISAQLLDVAS